MIGTAFQMQKKTNSTGFYFWGVPEESVTETGSRRWGPRLGGWEGHGVSLGTMAVTATQQCDCACWH